MNHSCFKTLLFLFIGILFVSAVFADSTIGELLESAMLAREAGTVAEVSDKFIVAANAASNYKQRANVLAIFSDYLLSKEEWEKIIEVQHDILGQNDYLNYPGAIYNLIRANLELNKVDAAREAAVDLNACPTGEHMREFAHTMKRLAPDCIHARVSDLLLSSPASQNLVEISCSRDIDNPQTQNQPCTSAKAVAATNLKTPPASAEKVVASKTSNRTSFTAGGWNSALKGKLKSKGMSLDYGSDLSSTKRQTSLVLAVETSPTDRDTFKATYVNFSFSGTLNKTKVHNAKIYNPGAAFNLRTKFLDLEGYRELQERSRANWGFLYGIVLTDSDLKVTQSIPGGSNVSRWGSRFGYPYLGLAAKSNSDKNVGWDASIKFFAWNGNGKYNTHDLQLKMLLGQGSGKKHSTRSLWGYLGYRDFRWKGDFGQDSAEILFSGPIFGLEYAW